ncbi:prefoldin subunit [Papiliotrema laurentii]|uniref:Prefoldin subunit n=1 Tax=Papiliotrema laurentii TaxID=5418 RepID=A0AAD9FUD0_PAPLA|nr:prefoldin subunit [Papiliotrema laurentii]
MATTAVAGSSKPQMETNPRGIPRAPFVADVEEYVGGKDAEIDGVMKTFQETSAKYRYMELSLQQRRKALGTKIPDIEQTLNVVRYLQLRRRKAAGEPIKEEEENEDDEDDLDEEEGEGKEDKLKTLFELNDTLYAEAEVDETGQVGLWLGANTMLLYPLQEAIDLLAAKLASAKKSLEETIEDLEWLREQVTVMEVNFARVHNWDVKRRRGQPKTTGMVGSSREGQDKGKDGSDDELD